jgi:hypothetical protein
MRYIGWTAAVLGLAVSAISVSADGPTVRLVADLNPLNEVPAVSSPASGRFTAVVNDDESIDYEISWQNLQAPITQSHIHFAQPNVNGAIVIWICGTATNPGPAGTQVCPATTSSGMVSGTIVPASIIAATTQGISAGDYAEVVRALGLGLAYANVHTTGSPGGEVRGQIRARRGPPEKDDKD